MAKEKLKQCNACLFTTLVKKIAFPTHEEDRPVFAWLCKPCVEKYKD